MRREFRCVKGTGAGRGFGIGEMMARSMGCKVIRIDRRAIPPATDADKWDDEWAAGYEERRALWNVKSGEEDK